MNIRDAVVEDVRIVVPTVCGRSDHLGVAVDNPHNADRGYRASMSSVDGFTLDEAAHINKAVLATERIRVPIVPMPIGDDLGRP